jgi:DNA-binding MarR family transcriptional regulator
MTRPTTTISTDAETAARLRLVISRLARAVRQHAAAGLTPSQVSALATIEEFGPIRMSDLAGYELIGAPVATRVVSSLQELALVQKAHGSTDGRVSLIELSDAGRETLNELWNERAAGLTARIERLRPDQIAVLTAALPVLETLVRDRVID